MVLPIDNKQRARVNTFGILMMLIFVLIFLYSFSNGLDITYFSIALVSFTLILTIRYLNKQNVNEAILFDDIIIVKHGREKIEINIEEIEEIYV